MEVTIATATIFV